MARHRELLRPEDASSLDEFQARHVAEVRQIHNARTSWKMMGRLYLPGVFAFIDIFFWFVVAKSSGAARWITVVFAVGVAWLVLRALIKAPTRGVPVTVREQDLERLEQEWQVKAERGEIPASTPGGPKVWRDELAPRIG